MDVLLPFQTLSSPVKNSIFLIEDYANPQHLSGPYQAWYCQPVGPMIQSRSLYLGIPFLGEWCNGSTAVFGTVDLGSNPGSPAFFLTVMKPLVDDEPHLTLQLKTVVFLYQPRVACCCTELFI